MMHPLDLPPALVIVFAALLGSAVGSFVNVCIFRLPREGLGISTPRRSFCPSCGFEIAWHDNIPLAAWLVLGGRCRVCRAPFSARYLLVEAGTALLFVLVAQRFILGDARSLPAALAVAALGAALVAVSLVDLDHRLIPDEITLPGMAVAPLAVLAAPEVLGADGSISRLLAGAAGELSRVPLPPFLRSAPVVAAAMVVAGGLLAAGAMIGYSAYWKAAHPTSPKRFGDAWLAGALAAQAGAAAALCALRPDLILTPRLHAFWASLAGMLAGSSLVLLVGIVGSRVFRKPAMGFGDVKLMGLLGAFTGWAGVLAGFFIACILGSIAGLYLLVRHGSRYLPFGPFLALGSFSLVLWPEAFSRLLRWYASLFA
jgi:leader peptidase (prepilin peptidase)/N-methyltransferase